MGYQKISLAVGLFLLALSPPGLTAEADLDPASTQALAKTQSMMTDQQAMENFAKGNPSATAALGQLKTLTANDPAKQAEVGNISSDIFASMVKNSGGDAAAIGQQLNNALKNPQAFMNSLTPEQQARIRQLASEIDKSNAQK